MAEIKEPIEAFGLSQKNRKRRLFSKIGVVGCGRDGRSIVSLTALSGMEVTFVDISKTKIDEALKDIEQGLDTKIENWGLTESEKRATMTRIKGSLDYSDLRDCDFVIECIRYDVDGDRSTALRKEVFRKLEEVLSSDAIIATNATTVIISELAAELKHKERCVSIHFPIAHTDARLLEIVRSTFTADAVIEKVFTFARLIKFMPVEIQESTGFISMRLLVVMLNESCQMWLENVANMEDIDKEFKVIYGQRYGIFELADIVGIEKIVMLMEDMFHDYGDKRYKASPILWRLYRSKHYGRSTQKGFYIYDEQGKIVSPNNII